MLAMKCTAKNKLKVIANHNYCISYYTIAKIIFFAQKKSCSSNENLS